MSSLRENRLFTLTIVPDSGYDIKSGNIDIRFITGLLSFLIVAFFVTLFIIIGYHIKLSQENEYADAVSVMRKYLDTIEKMR